MHNFLKFTINDKIQKSTILNVLDLNKNNALKSVNVPNLDTNAPLVFASHGLLVCKNYDLLINCFDISDQNGNIEAKFRTGEFCKYGAFKLTKHIQRFHKLQPSKLQPFADIYGSINAVSILDDFNLAYVYELLNLDDFLENICYPLSFSQKASVVCVILGEISAILKQFKNADDPKISQTISFLEKLKFCILQIIIETGRDRAAYNKNLFDTLYLQEAHNTGLNFKSNCKIEGTLFGEHNEDPKLTHTFLYGSLLTQCNRLQQLWYTFQGRGPILDAVLKEKIKRSVVSAVRNMTPYRKLMFTRLLVVIIENATAVPSKRLNLRSFVLKPIPEELALLLFDAFLSTNVPLWYYEDELQLETIRKSTILPNHVKEALHSLFIKKDFVSHHFELPDSFIQKLKTTKYIGDFNSEDIQMLAAKKKNEIKIL